MRACLPLFALLVPLAAMAQGPAPTPPAPGPSAPSPVATATLAGYERGTRLELTYGRVVSREDPYGTAFRGTALVALRFGPAAGGAYRLWVRWAKREFGSQGTQDMAAIGLSSDVSRQLARKVSVAFSIGGGAATVLHASNGLRHEEVPTLMAGLGLRFPYVITELQVLIIGGDLRMPLMVGIRL